MAWCNRYLRNFIVDDDGEHAILDAFHPFVGPGFPSAFIDGMIGTTGAGFALHLSMDQRRTQTVRCPIHRRNRQPHSASQGEITCFID
jgi:hypothetical protein